jgi:crossover junction endodeoxyribonuclease RuvC
MSKLYLGIDPGITGAWALIDKNLHVECLGDFEQRNGIGTESGRGNIMAVIEEAQAMPGQGVSSTFKYGVNFGRWLEWLDTWAIPHRRIRPSAWKKAVCDGGPRKGKDGKEYSLELARRLFPGAADSLKMKKDHNRAEALLLSYYARNTWEVPC